MLLAPGRMASLSCPSALNLAAQEFSPYRYPSVGSDAAERPQNDAQKEGVSGRAGADSLKNAAGLQIAIAEALRTACGTEPVLSLCSLRVLLTDSRLRKQIVPCALQVQSPHSLHQMS